MIFLYTLSIRLYALLALLVSPFYKKANLWVKGRKTWENDLRNFCQNKEANIWVHCASFGEYEDFVALLKLIKERFPSLNIILSFYSPSGYEYINDPSAFDFKFYLPQDSRKNALKVIEIIQPKFVLFSRSELWYFYLKTLKEKGVSSYLIGLNLDDKNGFLKPISKKFFAQCFHLFTKVYTLNERSTSLLKEHFNYQNTLTSGNPRIDRIFNKSIEGQKYPLIEKFVGEQFCVIGGSATEKDEEHLFACIHYFNLHPIKWIICPHDIDEEKMNKTIQENKNDYIRYKDLTEENYNDYKVLFIDFVGGLKSIYQYTDYALVGGGFIPKGIHNIIEPAIYGNPVTFGPNHRDYVEALEMMEAGYAKVHNNAEELNQLIEEAFNNDNRPELSYQIKEYVQRKTGAAQKVLEDLCLLENIGK